MSNSKIWRTRACHIERCRVTINVSRTRGTRSRLDHCYLRVLRCSSRYRFPPEVGFELKHRSGRRTIRRKRGDILDGRYKCRQCRGLQRGRRTRIRLNVQTATTETVADEEGADRNHNQQNTHGTLLEHDQQPARPHVCPATCACQEGGYSAADGAGSRALSCTIPTS